MGAGVTKHRYTESDDFKPRQPLYGKVVSHREVWFTDLTKRVGRTARGPLGGSFSVRPPAEPDWPVSEHPALR